MATATSYNVAGNREQILDVLTILEPEETPVVSMAKKLPATATFVEWQVDNLSAPAFGGVSEGEDVSSFETRPLIGRNWATTCKSSVVSGWCPTYKSW